MNEGSVREADILLGNGIIQRVGSVPDCSLTEKCTVLDIKGLYVMPGLIDDQVHFREPGLIQKGDIYTESMAAVAGGVTSYMEMPNTKPPTVTLKLLEEKYKSAQNRSFANYSFYLGATNDNLDELKKVKKNSIPGIKVFMGSSTGNMLVDDDKTLENIFSQIPLLVAIHSESESIIRENTEKIKAQYGENPPMSVHPLVRSAEACYDCSRKAVDFAQKFNTRLHILHLTTAREVELLKSVNGTKCSLLTDNRVPRITAEVTAQHLWFSDKDYADKGALIKWNPAVKSEEDRNALRQALLDDVIQVLATDHAPHTREEKDNTYFKCPSGGPMVQHSLLVMLELARQGVFPLERIPEFISHNPAKCFGVNNRGFIREGYAGDLVVVDMNRKTVVNPDNYFYKCKWSPFDGFTFNSKVIYTFVNAEQVFADGKIIAPPKGQRLVFGD
ncbi:MAG: dihydroorotase [Bacteroidales bacterium]|nr:dihydroorotase [Bacteroidales bacterium]